LTDISLKEKYSGICGFTFEELDLFFGDRMKKAYLALKKSKYFAPGSSVANLRAEVLKWYDGYIWGKTRDVEETLRKKLRKTLRKTLTKTRRKTLRSPLL
jgi:hypothetical protein